MLHRSQFPTDFVFGVSSSAYQTEGARDSDGKGPSIWDAFSDRNRKRWKGETGDVSSEFYHRYEEDLKLMAGLGIRNFRTSIAWSRVLPEGRVGVNERGLDFYDRLVDTCLSLGIEPWLTLYHWDLPLALERKGGWASRDILPAFEEFTTVVAKRLGDRVRHWMVLNEPMAFTGAGYFLGLHAPGRRGFSSFLPAVHHATLAMGVGGRILRDLLPTGAQIGTTFSQSWIDAHAPDERHHRAARRADVLLNRLFLEPILGMGYPLDEIAALRPLEKQMRPGDAEQMPFDFDFIGMQLYTREVIRHSWFTPYLWARIVHPRKRGVPHTVMGWEVYPQALYRMLKHWHEHYRIPRIIVTENGAAFPDQVLDGQVVDPERVAFLQEHIAEVARAREEGVPVEGYFTWTFTDNFEWSYRYGPRFGLVYVDYPTQQRIVKDSGRWYRDFLAGR